jgi:predicted nucleotidyltransferase
MKFGLPLAVIEQIQAVFTNYPVIDRVIIYGSRVKGTYKTGSDIDLSMFGNTISSEIHTEIQSDLEDLPIPYMIDLSIFEQIHNEKLKEHIMRVGQVFYERDQ